MNRRLCIFFVIITLISCSAHINSSYRPLKGKKYFDKEGHRGCRGLMPENTIPAYLKAVDLGVTTLEMDAVITKDSQVVMSHDPYFNHDITTKADGSYVTLQEEKSLKIYGMNYSEVKCYDVGMKINPRFTQQQKIPAVKPLLSDVIDSVEAYTTKTGNRPVQYNIETKCTPATDNIYHPEPGRFVELIMAVIKERKVESRVIIQSFDVRSLQYLHQKYPSIKTSLLVDGGNKKIFALQLQNLGFIPTIYSPEYHLVTPLLVKQCHDTGVELIPWTVDDKPTMDSLKNMGVDGIITDYPNLFSKK
ncbi:MAG TPA: glycerophosphodiester phosphodiesterase [Chitinophagaceae bacterium]|nr:glycerophosphodiester phosphodiesterase [Chitinophagaceae bacterium]